MALPKWFTVPNLLSLSRIILLPVLIWLAHSPWPVAFLVLYIIVGSTDFFDGIVARRFNWVTDAGKDFDAMCDLFFYLGSAYFLYVLYTPYIVANAVFFYVFFGMLAIYLFSPLVLFRKPLMMHTKLLKLGAVLVYFLVIMSFFFDTTWVVRGILFFYYVAFSEAVLMFLIYGEVDPDTPSIFSLRG